MLEGRLSREKFGGKRRGGCALSGYSLGWEIEEMGVGGRGRWFEGEEGGKRARGDEGSLVPWEERWEC